MDASFSYFLLEIWWNIGCLSISLISLRSIVGELCCFSSFWVFGCRLRLQAESKGFRLDDTGLFPAIQGSGGKRVWPFLITKKIKTIIFWFTWFCRAQKVLQIWNYIPKGRCLISWVFLGLNHMKEISKYRNSLVSLLEVWDTASSCDTGKWCLAWFWWALKSNAL